MQLYSSIYIICVLAVAGPTAHLGANALKISLRSVTTAVSTSSIASPADVEEEEELLDSASSDQSIAPSSPRPFQAQADQMPPAPAELQVPLEFASTPSRLKLASPVDEDVVAQRQTAPAASEAPQQTAQFQAAAPPRQTLQYMPLTSTAASAAGISGNYHPRVKMALAMTNSSQGEVKRPKDWPPRDDVYATCSPPCLAGRGLCNDNICFCRSPFTGSTCQHKMSALKPYRATKFLGVGFAGLCFLFGILLSKCFFGFTEHAVETRLERYGSGKRKYESWAPPLEEKDKIGRAGLL